MGSKGMKTWSFVVVTSFAGIVACSSTTTGSGGTAGKGGGLFGNPTGGTGGTSGTSGTTAGGGPTTVPTSCSASASDDSCNACLKKSCCDSTTSCANNAECVGIFDCARPCTEQSCFDNCIASHPAGQTDLRALVTCEQQFCVSACSTTSGGTSGTSGTPPADGCLPSNLQDPSFYCPNMPTRQNVKDCPNGSPSSQCVLSPSGSANVYCCP
jgi:hypothetical protein